MDLFVLMLIIGTLNDQRSLRCSISPWILATHVADPYALRPALRSYVFTPQRSRWSQRQAAENCGLVAELFIFRTGQLDPGQQLGVAVCFLVLLWTPHDDRPSATTTQFKS